MFSENKLTFHHCLCRKISLHFTVPNAAIPGTKDDTNLSYDCTCITVTHSTACSIKLFSHHLKQTVLIIPLYCACRKRNANVLVTNSGRQEEHFFAKTGKFYFYYQVFCTDINSFTFETNHLTMLNHVAVVVRIHDILMIFTMTNFCTFMLVP